MKTQLFLCIYLLGMVQNVHSQTWIPQGEGVLPFGYAISSMSVVDDTVIWVSAGLLAGWSNPMKVFKSIDAGETWETYDVTSCVNCKSGAIEAVNGSTAWLTSEDQLGFGKLYKTEDGGQTWELKLTDLSAIGAVKIFDNQHLLCQYYSYFAWSDDAGETWETAVVTGEPSGYQPYLAGPISGAGDTSWFGMIPPSNNDPGVSAKLIRATNFGRDISFIDCAIDSIYSISLVSFRDHLHGMMTYSTWQYVYDYYWGWYYSRSEQESLALSSDGGDTWSPIRNPTSGIKAILTIPDALSAYIVIDATQILWTMDGGETWTVQFLAYPLASIDFSSRNAGWVAINGTSSDHPLVLKWNGDFISATKDHSPISYREVRVFPNPSQDIIYYSIDDDHSQPHTLTLTDAVGQVVIEKEIHEMELNCSDLPAGVYFIRIQSKGWIGVARFVKD